MFYTHLNTNNYYPLENVIMQEYICILLLVFTEKSNLFYKFSTSCEKFGDYILKSAIFTWINLVMCIF